MQYPKHSTKQRIHGPPPATIIFNEKAATCITGGGPTIHRSILQGNNALDLFMESNISVLSLFLLYGSSWREVNLFDEPDTFATIIHIDDHRGTGFHIQPAMLPKDTI